MAAVVGRGTVAVGAQLASFPAIGRAPPRPRRVPSDRRCRRRHTRASILPISWMYIAMMGGEGLKAATESAMLAANCRPTPPHLSVLYSGLPGWSPTSASSICGR